MKNQKLIESILSGSKNIDFQDFQHFLELFGFSLARVHGSHYIYKQENIKELINVQNVNGKAKPYQVRQAIALIERHNLQVIDEA